MRSSKSRSRSKTNRPRTLGNIINRVFDSSGPEGKVRGTPQQIIEKYLFLARDAQLSNDRVAAENFLQHAEHYTRMLSEANRELAAEQESRQQFQPQGGQQGGGQQNGNQNGNQNGQRDRDGQRPDNRQEPRAEGRPDARPDTRVDFRSEPRIDNRSESKPENRTENRQDRDRTDTRRDERAPDRGEQRRDFRADYAPNRAADALIEPHGVIDLSDDADAGLVETPEAAIDRPVRSTQPRRAAAGVAPDAPASVEPGDAATADVAASDPPVSPVEKPGAKPRAAGTRRPRSPKPVVATTPEPDVPSGDTLREAAE